jgi:hypothetical protein
MSYYFGFDVFIEFDLRFKPVIEYMMLRVEDSDFRHHCEVGRYFKSPVAVHAGLWLQWLTADESVGEVSIYYSAPQVEYTDNAILFRSAFTTQGMQRTLDLFMNTFAPFIRSFAIKMECEGNEPDNNGNMTTIEWIPSPMSLCHDFPLVDLNRWIKDVAEAVERYRARKRDGAFS